MDSAPGNIDLSNYPGSKNAPGTLRKIINRIPAHKIMFELFGGSAVIGKNIYGGQGRPLESVLIINDINPAVCSSLNEIEDFNQSHISVINADALAVLQLIKSLCDIGVFNPKDIFIYLDPPYLKTTRRSSADIYKNEYTEDDHVQLLSAILQLRCSIMISGYDAGLYNDTLKWSSYSFPAMTRGGKAEEKIWMNYDIKKLKLQTYKYIGKNFTQRQQIKRKLTNLIAKVDRLPKREQESVVSSIIEKFC